MTAGVVHGTTIAGYRIERTIGSGRTGTTYLAERYVVDRTDVPRTDVLKVLNRDLADNPGFRARFLREADVGAQLRHPNVVEEYGRGSTDDGDLWVAMQYVDGVDADTALRGGAVTPVRAVHIVAQIAKVLDFAHSKGVVHRDIRPANFLLSGIVGRDERVLLGDFGIATATKAFAAPEIRNRLPADGRADIYSLGCSLFRLLTGTMPATDDGPHLDTAPPHVTAVAPGLPSAFDAVIAKAMAKEPTDRFPSGEQFAAAAIAALRPPAATHRQSPMPQKDVASGRLVNPEAAVAPLRFPAPDSRPVARNRRVLKAGAAVLGSVVFATVMALVLIGQQSGAALSSVSPSVSPAMVPTRTAEADARLLSLLPPGYGSDACHAIDPTDGARAKIACAAQVDALPADPPVTASPGALPVSGTATVKYLLMSDRQQLETALNNIVHTSAVVTCPGNIQSPGPWRRNATPEQASGTVFCGQDAGVATVGWSTEDQGLIAVVQAPTGGPNLEQLYAWWSTHS